MRNVLRINRLGSVGMLVLTTLLIALGGCYALERCSRHWLGALPVPLEQRLIFDRLYLAIPCVGAALWGYLRLRMVHPALETPYRTWLRATPWSSGKPLPLGPAYLAVGDAVVAGAMSVFVYWRTGRHVLLPPVAMLFGYLATSVAVLAAVGRAEATVILFLLPGAGALYQRWPLAAGVMVAAYGIALLGIHLAWADFPWKLDETKKNANPRSWPLVFLSPRMEETSAAAKLLSVTLLAWWLFCITSVVERQSPEPLPRDKHAAIICFIAMITAGVRWLMYRINTKAPISWLGRLVTGRLIVPGFDRYVIAPLVILSTGAAGAVGAAKYSPSAAATLAGGTFVLVSLAALLPPTLRQWRLTGQFHATPYRPAATAPVRRERARMASE